MSSESTFNECSWSTRKDRNKHGQDRFTATQKRMPFKQRKVLRTIQLLFTYKQRQHDSVEPLNDLPLVQADHKDVNFCLLAEVLGWKVSIRTRRNSYDFNKLVTVGCVQAAILMLQMPDAPVVEIADNDAGTLSDVEKKKQVCIQYNAWMYYVNIGLMLKCNHKHVCIPCVYDHNNLELLTNPIVCTNCCFYPLPRVTHGHHMQHMISNSAFEC